MAEVEIKPIRQPRRDQWPMTSMSEYQLCNHGEHYISFPPGQELEESSCHTQSALNPVSSDSISLPDLFSSAPTPE